MTEPRLYAFEELPPDLPWPPFAAVRAFRSSGISIAPIGWRALKPEARRQAVAAGSEDVVREDIVNEILRGMTVRDIALIPKPPQDPPPTPAIESALTSARLPRSAWERFRAVDRWVLSSIAAMKNTRLLLRALAEIATTCGVAPEPGTEEARVVLARCELVLAPGAAARVSNAGFFGGRALVLARVAGVRAARTAPTLIDRLNDTLVGPIEVESAVWGDRVLWQAHVSDPWGAFLPTVSLIAATTAAAALFDMLASADLAVSSSISEAVVREDAWIGGFVHGETTGSHPMAR